MAHIHGTQRRCINDHSSLGHLIWFTALCFDKSVAAGSQMYLTIKALGLSGISTSALQAGKDAM